MAAINGFSVMPTDPCRKQVELHVWLQGGCWAESAAVQTAWNAVTFVRRPLLPLKLKPWSAMRAQQPPTLLHWLQTLHGQKKTFPASWRCDGCLPESPCFVWRRVLSAAGVLWDAMQVTLPASEYSVAAARAAALLQRSRCSSGATSCTIVRGRRVRRRILLAARRIMMGSVQPWR